MLKRVVILVPAIVTILADVAAFAATGFVNLATEINTGSEN